ncbi:hypothetical protein E2562_013632 [Oryza meyeriana var. granulata]|uniref:Cyclin-like domain-containing protein n=1 Tax=Oryza meyeriana var. granulata TaxID=110450 RepID=A0A6G1F807_9ORYZ|nr:hypothetical protein E2562_013632 [Oryza meyeriana var. granulata]
MNSHISWSNYRLFSTSNSEVLSETPTEDFGGSSSRTISKLSCELMYSWYFTREELEKLSPSRKDGITENMESEIRQLYCSFIQEIGIRLKLPQMTIATAIMFCHRFYLQQSHAKNGWQTIATVCIFLASKVEDTPCPLDQVIRVAYGTMYRRDPATARRIHQKDVFEKQKALILTGERLVLATVRFDFNIQHPYRSLLDAMEKLGITQKEVKQVAWNFVNDWLKTTLCLQYKPQYIAAGSLYLAAKLLNIKLPVHGEHVWWHQFDVAPKPLEGTMEKTSSVLPVQMKADHLCVERKKIDVARIKDLLMKRKRRKERQEQHIPSIDLSEQAWIERELESGIVIKNADHVVASDDLSDEGWIERELESGIFVGQTNDKPVALDGLSEDDWIERELESGIIVEPRPAGKKLKSSFC